MRKNTGPFVNIRLITQLSVIFAIIFNTSSCSYKEKKAWKEFNKKFDHLTTTIDFDDFQEAKALILNKTGLNFSDAIVAMEVIDSSLLLSNRVDSLTITAISLTTLEVTDSFLKRGRGQNECLNISDVILTDSKSTFYAFDITLRKFFKYDINDLLKKNYTPIDIFELKENEFTGIKSPVSLSNNNFAALSYFDPKCRFIVFDKKKRSIARFGEMPPSQPGWPKQTLKGAEAIRPNSYAANLKRKPDSNAIVVAYSTTPRIELYKDNQLYRIVKGPDSFQPIYKFKEGRDIYPVEYNKTKFAYVKLKTYSDSIYTLYSGKDNFESCANKLLVFDWEGKPKVIYNLGITVCDFAIRSLKNDKKVLYTIDKSTGDLLFAEI